MRGSRAVVLAAAAVLVGAGVCGAARAQAPAASSAPSAPSAPAAAPAAPAPKDAERTAPEAPKDADDADDAPDLAFLEYLGSWQADDDEWLLIAEWDKDQTRDADENEGNTRAARRAAEAEARRGRAERKDDEEGG